MIVDCYYYLLLMVPKVLEKDCKQSTQTLVSFLGLRKNSRELFIKTSIKHNMTTIINSL